jgi:hypothetical protein
VSNFGINLDLKLNGQTSLDRAIRGAKTLENIVKRIKDTPLDLSNIGGAARLDEGRLGQARKNIIAFAKDLAKQEKPLANTEAGIREYVSAFNQLAANTKAGTPAFNAFVGVLAKAEKELDGVARATENARRAQQGMMSLEEREAQLEKRSSTLRVLRAKKKLKDEETASRKKNAREMEREAKAQERLNKQNERAEKSKRKRKFTDIAAGVGFPLLFGGGPGSVAGGALGGVFGGMGGSVLGGAIGQQLDKLGGSLIKTGAALNKPIEQFEEIIRLTGSFGREIGGQQGLLKSLELTEVAALQASQAFEEVYGTETANGLKDLSTAATEFQDTMTRLGIQLTAFSVGPLAEFLRQVSGALPKGRSEQLADEESKLRKELEPLKKELAEGLKFTESRQMPRGFYETQQDPNQKRLGPREIERLKKSIKEIDNEILEIEKERLAISGKFTKRLEDQTRVSEILKKQYEAIAEIGKRQTEQEEMRLTARRDTLAAFSAGTEIKQAELELSKIQENLRAAKELQKQPITKFDEGTFTRMSKNEGDIKKLDQDKIAAQENLNKLRAKGSNDELLARRAISKDELQAMNNIKKTTILRQQSHLEEFTFNKGREASFEGELLTLRQKFDLEEEIALSKNKQLLESVNELEVKTQLIKLHKHEADLRRRIFEAAERTTKESQAQFRLAKLAREQQAASRLQESQNRFELNMAQGQITPVGFFTESQKSIDIRELETEMALVQKRINLQNLENNLTREKGNLSKEETERRQFNIDQADLELQQFERNSAALNKQREFQDRYRDSLALTTPVVDSLFESLTAVVDGTKSAQEAFADFLNAMSQMLMDTAKQMIAQYIAIAIAKMFAGMGSGSSGQKLNLSEITKYSNVGANTRIMPFADGGRPPVGRPSLVGERGPELFVPGASGTIIPNHAMGGVNVGTINITVENTGEQLNPAAQKQLAGQVQGIVLSTLANERRSGGML